MVLWPHVTSLPPRQRAVIVLRYYEDLSEQEIADALGCSRGTVKSTAHHAFKSLRAALGDATTCREGGADMAIDIEQTLGRELREVADGLDDPGHAAAAEGAAPAPTPGGSRCWSRRRSPSSSPARSSSA